MLAISASLHPTSASRVTAVPRKSLNVTSAIPAFLQALPHDARKPSGVHGRLSVDVRMTGPCFLAESRAALSGAPTGIGIGAPRGRLRVIDLLGRSLMTEPS